MASLELKAKYKDVNEFILWKWERVFYLFFDRDHSGKVDSSDFYLITRQVRDIYGAESKQMTYARDSLAALWTSLLALVHKSEGQQVEIRDWVNVLRTLDPIKQTKWFTDYSNYLFRLFDVSEDGKLDLAEYTDGMICYGFKENEAHEAFKKFALDDKGKSIPSIDFQQYKKLWLDYFHSTDPNAPGSHLFGVLKR